MKKFILIPLLSLLLVLGATACFELEFAPYSRQETSFGNYAASGPTEWLWLGVHPDWASQFMRATNSTRIEVRACFGEAPTVYGRPYFAHKNEDTGYHYYSNATWASCSGWLTAAGLTVYGYLSTGWLRVAVYSPGENVTVQMRVDNNSRGEATPMAVAGRIADINNSVVYYDF